MNASVPHSDPYPFEEFAPTLSQCFVIVIIGYLIARLEILSTSDVKGVVNFACYFAMPGIICMSLADADFSDFRWELLFGVFLGKFFTFVAVAGLLFLLDGNLGVAGTVAIFCAQSNDLPVGNPLMSSLYKDHRPQMMKYLFLIPAMTVIFFVPISNIMVRLHRVRKCSGGAGRPHEEIPEFRECLWQCLQDKEHMNQMYSMAKNPVVIATALGLFLNVIFRGNMPGVLHQPIKVAAATIPGIALAMLGFSFVRKERYLMSSAVVPAMALSFLKMVVTPIFLHSILRLLTEGSESSKLLSDFALLYGIISPATAAFQTGPEFRKSLAVMSVALILTSFCCFPVSYVVARLTIVPAHKLSSYVPLLKNILFWTACLSIFCDLVVWVIMLWRNRWREVLCCYTMYLAFTQIITCIGVLVWSAGEREPWVTYCHMALYYGGEISGYLWTGTLAIVLVFKEKYSLLAENGFSILCFTAFSVSALITTVMCVMIPYGDVQSVYMVTRPRTNFEYLQLIIATFLLSVSLLVIAACLIFHLKKRKLRNDSTDVCAYDNSVFYIQEKEDTSKDNVTQNESVIPVKLDDKLGASDEAKIYYDEVVKSHCQEISSNEILSSEMRDWNFRLSSLLIMQGLVMLVRFIANLFKLVESRALEVMIPMEFLQSMLFVGQGIFILLTMGVDIRTAVISLRKWWRKARHGIDEMTGSSLEIVNSKGEVAQFCTQFYNFYYNHCFRDIAKERRWKGAVYEDSFWGHQLVDWMVSEGVCQEDTDAELRGQQLLAGGIIEHVTGRHHFYDAPYLYCFVKKKSEC